MDEINNKDYKLFVKFRFSPLGKLPCGLFWGP